MKLFNRIKKYMKFRIKKCDDEVFGHYLQKRIWFFMWKTVSIGYYDINDTLIYYKNTYKKYKKPIKYYYIQDNDELITTHKQ